MRVKDLPVFTHVRVIEPLMAALFGSVSTRRTPVRCSLLRNFTYETTLYAAKTGDEFAARPRQGTPHGHAGRPDRR
ncbi:hypothetical protein H4W33_007539 [Kibdelosporangium phytohabitans]|uniref:Uncharacterized protein n=1 Tax=Kibdelosporangium phytohabitans TaxID=860235 RepID=A0A0N9HZ88_9PSEU|nr:hypothetical protein AOZ06_09870 [Kibdelosporangium phytohabitans]MBE1468527.1 hypothetical protein [Kibdelosporangium phytohabitans]